MADAEKPIGDAIPEALAQMLGSFERGSAGRAEHAELEGAGLAQPEDIANALRDWLTTGLHEFRNPFNPSKFSIAEDDLKPGQALLNEYLQQVASNKDCLEVRPNEYPAGQEILRLPPGGQLLVVRAILVRWKLFVQELTEPKLFGPLLKKARSLFIFRAVLGHLFVSMMGTKRYQTHRGGAAIEELLAQLVLRKLPFVESDFVEMLRVAVLPGLLQLLPYFPLKALVRSLGKWLTQVGEECDSIIPFQKTDRIGHQPVMPESIRQGLTELHQVLVDGVVIPDYKKLIPRIDDLLGESETPSLLDRADAWAKAASEELRKLNTRERSAWIAVLGHAQSATASKPSKRWLDQARARIAEVEAESFKKSVEQWFPLAAKPRDPAPADQRAWQGENRHWLMPDPNAQILKGLVWMCATQEDAGLARLVGDLAEVCFKKIRWVGPRSTKVGNACLYALSGMPGTEGIAQLSRLKAKVKHASSRKMTAKALDVVATRTGLSNDELEEMSIPTYGLDPGGVQDHVSGPFPWGNRHHRDW
jgi:hypothetical protein